MGIKQCQDNLGKICLLLYNCWHSIYLLHSIILFFNPYLIPAIWRFWKVCQNSTGSKLWIKISALERSELVMVSWNELHPCCLAPKTIQEMPHETKMLLSCVGLFHRLSGVVTPSLIAWANQRRNFRERLTHQNNIFVTLTSSVCSGSFFWRNNIKFVCGSLFVN